jgi:DNA-binding MarR family transcriptional regulator
MSENNSDASALHLLHRAGQVADELFATRLGSSDITPRQHLVLATVATCKEPSQTTLVHKTGIDRSTLADIVRRLVERGLLQRRRTRHDARMYAVRLTEKGEEALKKSAPAAALTDESILAAIGGEDGVAFLRSLQAIVQAVEAQQQLAA